MIYLQWSLTFFPTSLRQQFPCLIFLVLFDMLTVAIKKKKKPNQRICACFISSPGHVCRLEFYQGTSALFNSGERSSVQKLSSKILLVCQPNCAQLRKSSSIVMNIVVNTILVFRQQESCRSNLISVHTYSSFL